MEILIAFGWAVLVGVVVWLVMTVVPFLAPYAAAGGLIAFGLVLLVQFSRNRPRL